MNLFKTIVLATAVVGGIASSAAAQSYYGYGYTGSTYPYGHQAYDEYQPRYYEGSRHYGGHSDYNRYYRQAR